MKSRTTIAILALALGIVLGMGALFGGVLAAPRSTEESASALAAQDQADVQADLQALPTIADFESGMPSGYFADPGGQIAANVVTDTTLAQFGAEPNHVLSVTVSGGRVWAGLQGFNLPSAQDWSSYDGVSFWFKGTNSGQTFLYVITQDAGAGLYQAEFTDDSADWKLVTLPWEAFMYREGASGTPTLSLTAVTAYFIQFSDDGGDTSFTGTFALDQMRLFDTVATDVYDFESGMPSDYFADPGGQIAANVVTDTTLAQFGAEPNHVLSVTVSGGRVWAGLQGFNLPSAQDWSSYDGVSFWFKGTNSGQTFLYVITQDAGAGLYQAEFTDDSADWKLVTLPWEAFMYREGASGTPTLSLTAVTAYFIQFSDGGGDTSFTGTFALDQMRLFDTVATDVYGFESGFPSGYFADPGGQIAANVVTDTTLTQFGAEPNHVLSVTVSGGRVWAGLQGFNLPSAQDWSSDSGVSFWFKGTNSGQTFLYVITQDAGAGLYQAEFTDDSADWKLVTLPWEAFMYREGASGTPTLSLTAVTAYFIQFSDDGGDTSFTGTFALDQMAVYGPNGVYYLNALASRPEKAPPKVEFSQQEYSVEEGNTLTVTAMLNMAATDPVTVTYAVTDVTATLTEDYTITHDIGQLYFALGETEQTFVINTIDDTEKETSETIALTLSDPVNAELGRAEATVTIEDNEAICGGRTMLIDTFENYSMTLPTNITDTYGNEIGFLTWSDGSPVEITTTQVVTGDALARPGQSMTNTLLKLDSDIVSWGGFTHNFENEAGDTWLTQDWSTYEGFGFWMYGTGSGVEVGIELQENRPLNATVPEDGGPEIWSYIFKDDTAGWRFVEIGWDKFTRKEIGNGAPNDGLTLEEVHGWAFISLASGGPQTHYFDNAQICGERVVEKELEVAFDAADYAVTEGDTATINVTLNYTTTTPVTVTYTSAESAGTPDRDFTPVSGTLVIPANTLSQSFTVPTLEDSKYEGVERVVLLLADPEGADLGFQRRAVLAIEDNDAVDPNLLDDFEGFHRYAVTGTATLSITEIMPGGAMALPGQQYYENVLTIDGGPVDLTRTFAEGRDWSNHAGLSFWYYGTNSGEEVTVKVMDNQLESTAVVSPSEWVLAWSQEFSETAGTAPDNSVWTHEIGDGALNDIVGWGNSELQYYTDSTDNVAIDGAGNLKITAREVDTSTTDLVCHYGPCEYTSARLISSDKVEFAYGKIEARVKVPSGAGLWPAFWMLGTDIDEVGWPQCGEIDIMEYVGKAPNEVFGTIHGPGYSGGNAFGDTYDFGYPVADDYHTFTIEWAPDEIHWYVDGINYHDATPADVDPNEWVYNHPFYIILNLAIGGNFGGPVDPDLTFPKEMLVDYVRVYQAEDTAERFEATFTDDFTGWRKVFVPFSDFTRSAEQPAGAPNDGLGLTEVWGYGLSMPDSGTVHVDYVGLYQTTYLPLVFKD